MPERVPFRSMHLLPSNSTPNPWCANVEAAAPNRTNTAIKALESLTLMEIDLLPEGKWKRLEINLILVRLLTSESTPAANLCQAPSMLRTLYRLPLAIRNAGSARRWRGLGEFCRVDGSVRPQFAELDNGSTV